METASVGALDLPAELAAQLHERDADVTWHRVEGPRTYVRAAGPDGELFAWCSRDPREAPMVDREVVIRDLVGREGPLRAPPLLAHGDGWRIERFIHSEPVRGEHAIAVAVAAAERLAGLTLPEAMASAGERRHHAIARRIMVGRSPLPLRDYLRARSFFVSSPLDRVTSHGDFHPIHLLLQGDAMWVIDWDRIAQRPAGFDLMQLWVHVEDADREPLFERTVELLGGRRLDVARIQYAVLTQTIAACFAERHAVNRDPDEGRRLLRLLPAVREAAGA